MKFIRWAQWRIDKNGEGIIGYIVNNSFLDGPTFRGMRQSLLNSFNAIYLLNLHGSNRRTEAAPTAQGDENVFDILQGVSILLCVKESDNTTPAKVYYADMWGSREEKYSTLSETDVQTTKWHEVQPTSPYYLFVPQVIAYRSEYESGWELNNVFHTGSVGIATGRDKLTIHRMLEKLRETVSDFVLLTELELKHKYNLKDSGDWNIISAQTDLRNHSAPEKQIQSIHYRPYDTCWTYYTGQSSGFHARPRRDIMRHLLVKNLALCVCRRRQKSNMATCLNNQPNYRQILYLKQNKRIYLRIPTLLVSESGGIADLDRTFAQSSSSPFLPHFRRRWNSHRVNRLIYPKAYHRKRFLPISMPFCIV